MKHFLLLALILSLFLIAVFSGLSGIVNATPTGTPQCLIGAFTDATFNLVKYPNGLWQFGDVTCEGTFSGTCTPDPSKQRKSLIEYVPDGCVFVLNNGRLHCDNNQTRLSYSLQCDDGTAPSFQEQITCPVDCVPAPSPTPFLCSDLGQYCTSTTDCCGAYVCVDSTCQVDIAGLSCTTPGFFGGCPSGPRTFWSM